MLGPGNQVTIRQKCFMDGIDVTILSKYSSYYLHILSDLVCLYLRGLEAVTADAPGDQSHAVHSPGVRVSAHLSKYEHIYSLSSNSESQ